jgi:DNA-directed RNA polymerase beta subunit
MHGILIEEMQVRFTSSDGGPEYTVPKYIVLYAGRYEEDLDIISYYETTNEMDEEEYDEEEYDEEEYDEEEDNEEDEEEYEYEDYRIKSEFI